MKKPKIKSTGGEKSSYLPSVELKGLGASPNIKKPAAAKKKSSLANAMAKIKF